MAIIFRLASEHADAALSVCVLREPEPRLIKHRKQTQHRGQAKRQKSAAAPALSMHGDIIPTRWEPNSIAVVQSGAELSLSHKPLKPQSLQVPTSVTLSASNPGPITWKKHYPRTTGALPEDEKLQLTRLREVPDDADVSSRGLLQAEVYTLRGTNLHCVIVFESCRGRPPVTTGPQMFGVADTEDQTTYQRAAILMPSGTEPAVHGADGNDNGANAADETIHIVGSAHDPSAARPAHSSSPMATLEPEVKVEAPSEPHTKRDLAEVAGRVSHGP
jgi:hypothetical protein